MKESDFICNSYQASSGQGKLTWTAPSNIALVKYWGKREPQLPANPSLSFTLSTSNTTTQLRYARSQSKNSKVDFKLFLDDKPKPSFRPKVEAFFERVLQYVPFLSEYELEIRTSNTFPHSSGIASSASGMSALALCLMSLEKELSGLQDEVYFWKKASFLARLGSGSACRSLQGPVVVWGQHDAIPGSSDLYGVPFSGQIHSVFESYQDTILLVDKGEKKVSSSVGHNLMQGHPYADSRFLHANKNLSNVVQIMKSGDLPAFVNLVESEALTLHAMMLSSNPYFLLMKPNTLQIIEKIFEFREDTGRQICFTLDAGANVHLLYPETDRISVLDFIESDLKQFCQQGQYLQDMVGQGAHFNR